MENQIYNAMNGTISAELKKELKELFGESVCFKLEAHQNENWVLWNLFLEGGKATLCIIDKLIYDLTPSKITAFENLIEKHKLQVWGIDADYACLKYAEAC